MSPPVPNVLVQTEQDHFELVGLESIEKAIRLFLETETNNNNNNNEDSYYWPPLFLSNYGVEDSSYLHDRKRETYYEAETQVSLNAFITSGQEATPTFSKSVTKPTSSPAYGNHAIPFAVQTTLEKAMLTAAEEVAICEYPQSVASKSGATVDPVPSTTKAVKVFQGKNRGEQRRLTFRMEETPDISRIQSNPDVALERAYRICGNSIKPTDTASLDGDWEESRMDPPAKLRDLPEEKFQDMLLYELKLANDETDRLAQDIFAEETSASAEPSFSDNNDVGDAAATTFDIVRLREWYDRVADSYSKGIPLVKVNMKGEKLLRIVKVEGDYFSVSIPNDGFRKTHLAYMSKAKIGYGSGEFMRLIEITEEGAEIPLIQMCGVVRMPSRSVSLVFPSEVSRNEFTFLLRVKLRATKYMYGDGTMAVLRANTSGRQLRPMGTFDCNDAQAYNEEALNNI